MEIYFDGYCPESLLKAKQVEMRLNEDDFWESEATGLQMTIFPPFAAILRWRGKGKFRESSDVASNSLVGLVITEAKQEAGEEIFPDEESIISNHIELERYLGKIYSSKKELDAATFNPNDPVFHEQEQYLNSIAKEDFQKIVQLFDTLKRDEYNDEFMCTNTFQDLHKMMYALKLIFSFDWMAWHQGWKNINDKNFDYSRCSLLDTSMYLTAIFRADRFNKGTIEQKCKDGTLENIFDRLR